MHPMNTISGIRRGRGRPATSLVRQQMIEILKKNERLYGYELHQKYCAIYPSVTLRLIYYHLHKGVERGEFAIEQKKLIEGNYSWGTKSEHIVYILGTNAKTTQ